MTCTICAQPIEGPGPDRCAVCAGDLADLTAALGAPRHYTVAVYDLREHTSRDHYVEAWTAEDAITQARLEHCNVHDADRRPLRRVESVRPRRSA